MSSKLFSSIYKKYLRDTQIITGLMPAEYKSLLELLRERKPSIRLRDGSNHLFSREELEKMASEIPWYMHSLVKLPVIVVKEGNSYRLVGDRWGLRAVQLILKGELKFTPSPTLSQGDVERLVRDYRSIVFITIRREEQGAEEPRE